MKNPIHLSPDIKKHIERGEHLKLLIGSAGKIVQQVDFKNEVISETYTSSGMYQLFLSTEIPKKQELYCLFPNHRVEKKQLLRVSDYFNLSSLNKDINAAFSASLDETTLYGGIKIAVCYGRHVFVCREISGTVYIVWASHVNKTNAGNVASTLYYNVPVILNFDGQTRLKGLFILKDAISDSSELERIPITKNSLKLLFPTNKSLFVCEVKAEPPPPAPETLVKTVTRKEALASVLTYTKDTNIVLRQERNPFEKSINMEEDLEYTGIGIVFERTPRSSSSNSNNGSSEYYRKGVDRGTPREDLFFQDTNVSDAARAGKTPPIVRSDGENTADPFVDDSDDDAPPPPPLKPLVPQLFFNNKQEDKN